MPTSYPAVELILARLRESGDFPAMARTVGSVSALTSSEDTSISALADTVLQDYGLAQKLLRLVNTASYAQQGQVTTVSRAVLLMGFDRVRTVATGLMLFEHLQGQAKSPALLDALNMSFYSAILGKTIAGQTGFADKEEAFISALFHNLGRTLVALYLPAEVAQIQTAHTNPDAAVVRVLGMSYSSIGIGIAKAMNLPERLQQSMVRVTGSQVHPSMTEEEQLGCVATLSNGIADALATTGGARSKTQTIERLLKSYGSHFATLDGHVDALIAEAETELHAHAKAFRLDLQNSAFAAGLSDWRAETKAGALTQVANVTDAGGLIETAAADLPGEDNPEVLLTQGLHEVTLLLVTDFTLDDVLRVILETIYRALGVGRTRAFFLLKDPSGSRARFKFGMGQSAADMRTWMEVPLRGANDIFGLALQQSRDLVVKDLSVPDLAPLLPDWYRSTAAERRFAVLLPLAVNQKAVGLFYIDGTGDAAHLLTPTVINNLKVLRGQAALAIHQNTLRAAARKR